MELPGMTPGTIVAAEAEADDTKLLLLLFHPLFDSPAWMSCYSPVNLILRPWPLGEKPCM